MRAVAQALLKTLLAHHATIFRDEIAKHRIKSCCITYGDLCTKAGCPEMTLSIGTFLKEISQWCAERGLPPLNALAVNASTGIPAYNYDKGVDCSIDKWEEQVTSCITCKEYLNV